MSQTSPATDPFWPTAPLEGLVLQVVPDIGEYSPETEAENTNRYETSDLAAATVITSMMVEPRGRHKVVLDIDLPAKLVPSTTPGHFHLYIDQEVDWPTYSKLLSALAEAGIVEKPYASVSQARGYTAARLPWVKKQPPKHT